MNCSTVAVERRPQLIDLPALAEQVWSGQIGRVEWTGFGQRMENFLPPERYQDTFISPFKTPMGFGPEYLVCPVRAKDILHGPHPDYGLTPVKFYRDTAAMTGLAPVFIGQTEPNPYMDRIRAAFPDNIFLAVNGLFNPMQKTDVDLLPFGDPRYKFFLFPIDYAVPVDCHAEVRRRIAPFWRRMPHVALRRLARTVDLDR